MSSKLPSGYTQLEYIQSSGNQYINSGVSGDSDIRTVMDFEFDAKGSGTVFAFGSQGTDSVRYTLALTSSGNFRSDYGTQMTTGPAAAIGTRYSIDKNRNVCKISGTPVSSSAQTFNGTTSIYLFARSYSSLSCSKGKLFFCKILKGDTLLRDFIPCKNANGAVGLYDTVEGQFYGNAGTGTFAAGPEILPPAAPAGLHTVLAVVLQWAASANADRYDVYRDGAKLGSTEGTQYVDATPEANQTYVYTVKAVNGGGESAGASITVYTKSGYFEYKPLIESANFP